MNFVSHAGPVRKQEDNAIQISETEAKKQEIIQWNQRKHTDMRVRGLTVQWRERVLGDDNGCDTVPLCVSD